ncbi:hypothetical protein MHH60_00850 [Paenibacillus sp. FSL H7-0716]|uniref:Uncharacterized protein n=1 Tax=Paenibacillus odorifer TaxID=189426 RepID=A0AAD0KKU9_9BACL|nr:hypothetical protein [Paenibacillus odorifer]AWV33655.1 hypothetical protein CD191_14115 [Paenibacillus odorifer]OME20084.1 hypothetical protein BSK47_13205 [Paenibacillus odorifer]
MDIEPCKDLVEAEEIIQYHLEDLGCRWGMFENAKNEFVGTRLEFERDAELRDQLLYFVLKRNR